MIKRWRAGGTGGLWGDGVGSLFPLLFFFLFFKVVGEGLVLFMLLVIQKGSRETGLEKLEQGNERAVYVYEERKKRRKRKAEEESGDGLTVKCVLVVLIADFRLVCRF